MDLEDAAHGRRDPDLAPVRQAQRGNRPGRRPVERMGQPVRADEIGRRVDCGIEQALYWKPLTEVGWCRIWATSGRLIEGVTVPTTRSPSAIKTLVAGRLVAGSTA